jgi:uncharacterized protein YdaU (DUF1376 family)
MKALDEFPISISAYIADTQHLSTLQHGAYLLLLMTMRRAGGWLPDDDRKLANIVKLTMAKWKQIAPDIRSLLVTKGGQVSQKRILSDIEKHRVLSLRNASNGKTGGLAKALKSKEPNLATATVSPAISPADRQNDEVNAIPSLLTTSTDSKIQKKERNSAGRSLPSDWVADAIDHAYAQKLGMTIPEAESCAEDLRLWARANANRAVGRKADWRSTYHGWMRREAPKIIRQRGFSTRAKHGKTQGTINTSQLGFSELAALARRGPPQSPRPAPEDLEPINRR